MTKQKRWWTDDDWSPPKGAHRVEALDALWGPVACNEHSVQVEDGEGTHDLVGDGFQPDCISCAQAAARAREHVAQVERSNR